MTFTIIRVGMISIWIACAYIWGDWKNWRSYYPTMLFFAAGDLIYNIVFFKNPLWRFEPDFLVPSLNELFIIFTIFFATTLLYLSKFPDKLFNQIIYITFWILLYIAIELFTTSIGMQKNYNGWNIWWSLLHNTIQFPVLIIHHKNPILGWAVAFTFLFIIMRIFNVPYILSK